MSRILYLDLLFLYFLFFFIVGLFIYNWRIFYNFVRELPPRVLFMGIFIFCIAFILCEYIIPRMHHVYYDEFGYINVAQNIYHHNLAYDTVIGDRLHPEVIGNFLRPAGYPLLINFTFRLLGDSAASVFQLNILLGSLSALLVFYIVYIFFSSIAVSFWASLIFTILPIHLKYSSSGTADISSVFFILLAIWLVLLFLKAKKKRLLYSALLCTIFSCYIKPENLILYFPAVLLIIIGSKKGYINRKDILGFAFYSILLSLPLLSKVPYMIRQEQTNASGSFVSLKNFIFNLFPNFIYLFDFRYHLLIATIFFIAGSIILFFKDRIKWLFLISWFVIFYFIFTAHFTGKFSLQFFTDFDRHFLYPAIPFCILAGYAISYILKRSFHFRKRGFLIIIILSTLVLNSIIATKNIVGFTFERNEYKEQQFLSKISNEIPKNIYILCYNPSYLIVTMDRKAMNLSFLSALAEFPENLILYKGFWWFELKERSDTYEITLNNLYNLDTLKEEQIGADKKYGFYLLTKKQQD